MKPLAFNLRDAKKVAGDKHSSTFVLKDGHQIKVAHAPLPALQRKQLEKLPVHLATGGGAAQGVLAGDDLQDSPEMLQKADDIRSSYQNAPGADLTPAQSELAQNEISALPIESNDPATRADIQSVKELTKDTPAARVTDSVPEATQVPEMGTPVGAKPLDTTPAKDVANVAGLVATGNRGIKEQESYEKSLAESNAKSEEADITARQNILADFGKKHQEFQAEQKSFLQDLANQKIDPNHYVESMDSSQKVATAIGLILGGIASPYSHGNPALEFLNKQIDRDIEAQKQRIEQKKTLFGANQELYHDSTLAENATRMQMNDIYSHQIQLNAAKLGTPAAKAKADSATAKFGLENVQLLQQNAVRAAVLNAVHQGGAGLDATSLAQAGLMTSAQAEKEQGSIDTQKKAIANVKNIYSQLQQEQTAANLANPQSYDRAKALKAQLVNTIMEASASKRLTRESIEQEINPLFIKTTNTGQTSQAKLNGVLNLIGQHAEPTPIMSKYAPASVPQYPFQQAGQSQQYKVGDILYAGGKKIQIINSKGDYRLVK